MKMLNDRFIDELETTLQKENKLNCNLVIAHLKSLSNFVILDAQLNQREKEQEKN